MKIPWRRARSREIRGGGQCHHPKRADMAGHHREQWRWQEGSGSGYILKEMLAEFGGRLEVRSERWEDDFRDLGIKLLVYW